MLTILASIKIIGNIIFELLAVCGEVVVSSDGTLELLLLFSLSVTSLVLRQELVTMKQQKDSVSF